MDGTVEDVVAIDGPAASGKSTVAARVAEKLGATYVNTGNMYRAVTLAALRRFGKEAPLDAGEVVGILDAVSLEYVFSGDGTPLLLLDAENVEREIRTPEVAERVSAIAAIPRVREWLVERQRAFAKNGTIVMEGRDFGTVVFPNAKHKFYLTASPEVRAERRLAQDGECPDGATVESVAREIAERDKKDMERPVSPLRRADGAALIDTGGMSVDEVVEAVVVAIAEEKE